MGRKRRSGVPPLKHGKMKNSQMSVVQLFEEYDVAPNSASFAISQIRQHGTPFVLVVSPDGWIRGADRRQGWRELLESIAPLRENRLPEKLAAVVARHWMNPPPDHAATVTLVGEDAVASVTGLEGCKDLFACSIWHLRRDRALDAARRRYSLTNRECELLDRVLLGESSAEIARVLSISLATVEWHTKRLLLKTDSQNRTQMATRVLGWLPDPA
jgi:DNA-binding CsgD family transcriptional regulator